MNDDARVIRGDALDRAETAWSMRVAGGTWAAIAKVTGYSNGENCARAVKAMYGTLPEPTRTDRRDLWRARLERLWLHGLQDAIEDRPGAVTACVRIATAAAALDGLNEPVKVDLEVSQVFEGLLTEARNAGLA